MLFHVGDREYPFMVIVEGEVAIVDEHGHELLRHQARGFIGEINLLTGQTAYLGAVVTQPMRYIAVEREALRQLMFDEGPLGELILGAFIARRETLQAMDVGFEIIGPRSSAPTRRLVDFARRSRLAYTWHDLDDPAAAPLATPGAGAAADQYPLVRLPGGDRAEQPVRRRAVSRTGNRT